MVFIYSLRVARANIKGYFRRFTSLPFLSSSLYKFPSASTDGKIFTTRHYAPYSASSFPVPHINNAKIPHIFELARWEVSAGTSKLMDMSFKGKCYPVIASTHLSFFREVNPGSFVTVQTAILGVTAKGNQLVFIQNMYSDESAGIFDKFPPLSYCFNNLEKAKKLASKDEKLVATALFHISMIDGKVGRPIPPKLACERMGTTLDEFCLLGGSDVVEMNSLEDVLAAEDKIKSKIAEKGYSESANVPGFLFQKLDDTIGSEKCLVANAKAIGRITEASGDQRKWFKLGSNNNSSKNSKTKKMMMEESEKSSTKTSTTD